LTDQSLIKPGQVSNKKRSLADSKFEQNLGRSFLAQIY